MITLPKVNIFHLYKNIAHDTINFVDGIQSTLEGKQHSIEINLQITWG